MHDLKTITDSSHFSVGTAGGTRVAFLHRSFRSVGMSRGLEGDSFGAHFPGLGLLNLAQGLRSAESVGDVPALEVRYFDEEAFAHEADLREDLIRWLDAAGRRVIASGTYTPTIDRLEGFLGTFDPSRYLIIVGGAHASVAPDIANTHIAVRGEGHAAMRHVLSTFPDPERFGFGIPQFGLNYVYDGLLVADRPQFDESLATMGTPAFAYDLLPLALTTSPAYATSLTRMLGVRPQVYICTQSCRSRCTFCSTYLIHGRTVARPVDKVRADLRQLVDTYGCDTIEFHDDDLTQHPEFDDLLEVMSELGLPWFCYLRVDGINAKRASDMAAAGCGRSFVGVEAMNQETLDYFRKNVTVEQNAASIQWLAESGIRTIVGFIIGAPAHTVSSILADTERFLAMPLHALNCTILSPDPGTVEFVRARQKNHYSDKVAAKAGLLRVLPDVEEYGIEYPTGLPTVCEHVSKRDLNRLRDLIDAAFYLRPDIYVSLTEGRSAVQRMEVNRYYSWLVDRLGAEYQGDDEVVEFSRQLQMQVAAQGWPSILAGAQATAAEVTR